MQNSSMVLVAAALMACTASVVAQERAPQVPAERPQVPAERVQPPAEVIVPPAPAVTPNRETSGAANSARRTEPPSPEPRGGKHEDEDQTAPSAPKR